MSRGNWSRQETLMALAFYLCPPLPRKNWDDSDTEIRLLAGEIGHTESAVCLKIANLKACDPNRTGLGFANTAGMDRQVISECLADPDATMSEAVWELEQIAPPGKDESTWPNLDFVHCHNDCIFEQYA